jgi:diguanylate cyclase (GGDEF)-like protein
MDIAAKPKDVALTEKADVDALTKLPTRHRLMEALTDLFGNAPFASPALILIDRDRFKSANDGFGPDVGDALLWRVAQRLIGLTKGATMLARVSGDGFGVLLEDSGGALRMAERVLEFVSRPYAVSGHSITLGASVGLAVAPHDGIDAPALFHSADLALHEAEHDRHSSLRCFESGMQTRAFHRRFLETELRTALAMQQVELRRALLSEQFEVHYQPQVRLADRRLTGFEALLRWRHPERGLIPPSEFIPVAEEIGLIGLLGDWVLRVACRDAAQWPVPSGGTPLRIAVNVSPLQLHEGTALLNAVRCALDESCLAAETLELEITETALTSDARELLHSVKKLGCQLALDDFGTGYSSLGRLRDLPFDRIKIDRSFMRDLEEFVPEHERRSALWMIRAIASLSTGLGLTTVAEGIETKQQATLAFDAGCTEMQGFLISRALPADQITDFIINMNEAQEKPEDV